MSKLIEMITEHFPHLKGYKYYDIFEHFDYINQRYITLDDIKELMLKAIKDALEKAAENAEVLPEPEHMPDFWQFARIDKETITSVIDHYK
jgi:hypothetical protein